MTSLKTTEKKLIQSIRQELELDRLLDQATEQRMARTTSRHALHARLKEHASMVRDRDYAETVALHEVAAGLPKRDWYLAKTFL